MSLEFIRQTIKCLNAEIILHGNRCVGLIDSGSSILLLSWFTCKKLGKPGIVLTNTKRLLTANSSIFKIIGRVTLLVQLQPRLSEVEHKSVITADECINCLLGIDLLKTQKLVLNLREAKLYSNHFKISIPLTTEKTQGVQFFAIAGRNNHIQIKNENVKKLRLTDKNRKENPQMEQLEQAIEDFELKTGLLLAACMISMKDWSNLINVINLTDAPVTVYETTKVRTYFDSKQNLVVNEICTHLKQPKTLEIFQMGKHANLEGSNLNK